MTGAPTGARGEAYLTVDGQELPILLTNRALANVERMTGRAITATIEELSRGRLAIGDAAALLCEGLEQARREGRTRAQPYRMDDAWDIIDALGYVAVMEVVVVALRAVLEDWIERKDSADISPPA